LKLWPTAISYAIGYFFIAIVWVNHHHLLRFPDVATHRLVWGNFAHLFAISLMPFATAWIASTRLGAVPVAFRDYKSNVALNPSFQHYFRTHRPPFLAVWGQERSILPSAGRRSV
jgi:uncharacterized membrane protein